MTSPIKLVLVSAITLFPAVIISSSSITPTQTTTAKPLGGGGGELAFVVSNVNSYSGDPSNTGLFLIDSDGNNLHHFPDIKSPPLEFTTISDHAENVLWSPDGKRIAFYSGNYKDSKSFLVSADGDQMVILENGLRVKAWSPDGKSIAFDDSFGDPSNTTFCIGQASPFDTSAVNVHYSDIFTWCDYVSDNYVEGHVGILPTWSPDGQLVMFFSNEYGLRASASPDDIDTLPLQIYVANTAGTKIQSLAQNGIDDQYAVWSPDGKSITIINQSNQICLIKLDGLGKRCIAPEIANITDYQWAPDGKHIAFLSGNKSDNLSLHVMTSAGTGFAQIAASKYVISSFSWSPDSKYIAFDATCKCEAKPVSQIYVVGVDGSGLNQLTHFTNQDLEAHNPAWQP